MKQLIDRAYFTASMNCTSYLQRIRQACFDAAFSRPVETERFDYKRAEFWIAKHPALWGFFSYRIKHPRRLRRKNARAYGFICRPEDVESLRKNGYLVRLETVQCGSRYSRLRLTFWTTNAKPGTALELAG